MFGPTARRRRIPAAALVLPLAVLLPLAAGAAVAINPVVALAVTGVTFVVLGLLARGEEAGRVFLGALAVILVIYAFLNKGGAYIGIAPLYISEVVLFIGLIALLLSLGRMRPGIIHGLLIVFMIWGLARTIPFVGLYALDALRDAVTWAYGLFALVVATVIRASDYRTIVAWYRKLVPAFVIAMPLVAIGTRAFDAYIPKWPNTPQGGVGILSFGNGHTGVHLAGVGAFILLGLYGYTRRNRAWEPIIWVIWLVGTAIVGSLNRGSLLAASCCGLAFAFVQSHSRWLSVGILAPVILALAAAVNPVVDLGTVRKVSFDQLLQNVLSVVGGSSNQDLEGTAEWRLAWWNEIINYTIDGPYFWDGKGYGINLADADGFQVNADGSLRAPHNGHMEILARSGVPGLVLWIILQAAYLIGLIRAAIGAHRAGRHFWVRIHAWLLVYWAASMVNMSFDPYLQGPQGGIWFWALFGLGLAAMRLWRTDEGAETDALEMAPAPDEVAPVLPRLPFPAGAN